MEDMSRRSFLKGGAAVAAGLAAFTAVPVASAMETATSGETDSSGASAVAERSYAVREFDVVIVGSGMAGLTAARRAIAGGSTVAIVDKGQYGHSGASGLNWGHAIVSQEFNDDPDAASTLAAGLPYGGDGMIDQEYGAALAQAFKDAKPICESVQMGCVTEHLKDGTPSCGNALAEGSSISSDAGLFPRIYAQRVKRMGAQVFDFTYVLDVLLSPEGEAAGIATIDLATGEPVVFRAKSVILATGSYVWLCGWNGVTAYSQSSGDCTGDGAAMCLRLGLPMRDMEEICYDNGQYAPAGTRQCMTGVGVEITDHYRGFNKDFELFSQPLIDDPTNCYNQGAYMRLEMKEIWEGRGTEHGGIWANTDDLDTEERYYRNAKWNMKRIFNWDMPQYVEVIPQAWETAGRPFTLEPTTSMTEVPGLYNASAAAFVWAGLAVGSSIGGGWLAGDAAAARAAEGERPEIDRQQVQQVFNEAYGLLENQSDDGIRAHTLMRSVQEAFWDGMYFLRDEKGIQGTIDELTRIQKEDLPRMMVPDSMPQFNMEWRDALEVRNMITVGVGSAQAALIRRESRGAHCRKDYPAVDNENFMANTKVTLGQDGWTSEMVPIDGPSIDHDTLVATIPHVGME